jgi:hypothetical protein
VPDVLDSAGQVPEVLSDAEPAAGAPDEDPR